MLDSALRHWCWTHLKVEPLVVVVGVDVCTEEEIVLIRADLKVKDQTPSITGEFEYNDL